MNAVRQAWMLLIKHRKAPELRSIIGLFVGSVPGFLLPIIATVLMAPAEADNFLLGVGAAVLLGTLVASTLEASLVSSYGRVLVGGRQPTRADLVAASVRALCVAGPASLVVFPCLIYLYWRFGSISISYNELVFALLPLAAFPVLATQSAVWSAYLNACQSFGRLFMTGALRGLPSIALLFMTHDLSMLSTAYVVGELIRMCVLVRLGSNRIKRSSCYVQDVRNLELPSIGGWFLQILSMVVGCCFGQVQRVLLLASPPGSLAAADSAEKVYFVANQVGLSGGVLPSVSRLPKKLLGAADSRVKCVLKMELLRVVKFASLLGALGIGALIVIRSGQFDILDKLSLALFWAQILLVGVPFMAMNTWSSRVLVSAGLSKVLVPLSLGMLAVGGGACVSIGRAFGPTGLIFASTSTQVIVGVAYVVCTLKMAPRRLVLSSELISSDGKVSSSPVQVGSQRSEVP